jgi:hypothetical protein
LQPSVNHDFPGKSEDLVRLSGNTDVIGLLGGYCVEASTISPRLSRQRSESLIPSSAQTLFGLLFRFGLLFILVSRSPLLLHGHPVAQLTFCWPGHLFALARSALIYRVYVLATPALVIAASPLLRPRLSLVESLGSAVALGAALSFIFS